MSDHYTALGKEVMHDKRHFADARDPAGARLIADALNYWRHGEEPTDDRTGELFPADPHTIRRESDEYACSCGRRWDVTDGEEHP